MSSNLKINIFLFFILHSKIVIESSEILVLIPKNFSSHFITIYPIVTALADRGHNITIYTAKTFGHHKNIKEILITYNSSLLAGQDLTTLGNGLNLILYMHRYAIDMAEDFLQTPQYQELLNVDTKRYDAIMTSSQFVRELAVPLVHKHGALTINVLPHSNSPAHSLLAGVPFNPSYFVDVRLSYNDRMTFFERCHNTLTTFFSLIVEYALTIVKLEQFAEEYSKYKNRPKLADQLSNNSIVIINSHFSINYPYPLPPNAVEIAGIQIKDSKPLPKNIEDFIDKWTEGVLLLSWGTIVRGQKIDNDVLHTSIIEAFKRIKLGVIWKTNLKEFPVDVPDNVFVSDWLPQQDILAHKNIKLMATHGGLNSIVEAVYYGVPVICTPFFLDQGKNVKRLIDIGMGVQLTSENITADSMVWAIEEVANNVRYKEAAKKHSAIFRDRPVPIRDQVVHSVEYALKYGDVLKPSYTNMPFYQILLLDVIAVLLIMFLSVIFLIKYLINKCFK